MKYLIILLISINCQAFVKSDIAAKRAAEYRVRIGLEKLKKEAWMYREFTRQVDSSINESIEAGHTGAFIVPRYAILQRHKDDIVYKLQKLGYKVKWVNYEFGQALDVLW